MLTNEVDHHLEELEQWLGLANPAADHDACVIVTLKILTDLPHRVVRVESHETEIGWDCLLLEPLLAPCQRGADELWVNAEMSDGVRVDPDDERTTCRWR